MNHLKKYGVLFWDSYQSWSEDKVPRLAAALAYYTIFSIAPLLIIVIGIAGFVFGSQSAQGQIMGQVQGLIGEQGASGIKTVMAGTEQPKTGLFASILGILMLLFGATGVFSELQDSLNTIWGVQPKPDAGLRHTIKTRLLSASVVFGIGFLLLVSLIISAALAALGKVLQGSFGAYEWIFHIVNFVISFGIITLLFAMMFKVLPDAKIAWRDVWIGSILTSFLFTIGKFLIGLYLGKSSFSSAYGAVGSVLIIILWVYYSSQILFFGAEFTKVYANRYGSRIKPAPGAAPITDEARAEQGIPKKNQT